jgi:hypothetical protein
MAGVPVVCSNRVGAGAVVEKWQCGAIFTSEDVFDLGQKLTEIVFAPESLAKMRLATQNASAVLEPEVAGRYMLDVLLRQSSTVLRQSNSLCPWYEGLN